MGLFAYFEARGRKKAGAKLLEETFGSFSSAIDFGGRTLLPAELSTVLVERAWRGSADMLVGKTPMLSGAKPDPVSVAITALLDSLKYPSTIGNLKTTGIFLSLLHNLLVVAIERQAQQKLNSLDAGLIEDGARGYLILSGKPYDDSQRAIQQIL